MVHLRIFTDGATPIWSIIELQGDIILPEDWQEHDVVELGTLLLSPQVGVPSECAILYAHTLQLDFVVPRQLRLQLRSDD